jgi:hypothetical protein
VQELSRAGITPTYNAGTVTDGDGFTNDGVTFIHVLNTGGSTTLTIQTPGTVDGLAITDRTVTIPATTGTKLIGPFPVDKYNQSDGKVYLDWSQVTGITFAVVRMP